MIIINLSAYTERQLYNLSMRVRFTLQETYRALEFAEVVQPNDGGLRMRLAERPDVAGKYAIQI